MMILKNWQRKNKENRKCIRNWDGAKWEHFNTLLFCGFEKSTKNKVHRGLRGSSPLEQIKML